MEFDNIVSEIQKHLSSETQTLEKLIRSIKNHSEQKVLSTLRWLMDSGQVAQKGNQFIWNG